MEFRIADTFTDSLARLTGEEQKAVKTAAFDLQLNPSSSESAISQTSESERSELLVYPGEPGRSTDRS